MKLWWFSTTVINSDWEYQSISVDLPKSFRFWEPQKPNHWGTQKRKHTITLAVVNQFVFAIWPMIITESIFWIPNANQTFFQSLCFSHIFSPFGDLPKVSSWAPAAPAALKFRLLLDQDQAVWRLLSFGPMWLRYRILNKKTLQVKIGSSQIKVCKPWSELELETMTFWISKNNIQTKTLIPCARAMLIGTSEMDAIILAFQKWEAAGKPSHNTKVDSRSTWCHIHEDIDATLQGTHDFVSSYLGQRDLVDDLRPLCWRWVMPSVPVCSRVNGGKCMETVGNLL